jgi:hypothetical protein
VQRRRVGDLVALDLARLLHDEQRRGLREVAVEQLVQLVLRIAPGDDRGDEPHHHHGAEHEREQPRLQRTRAHRHDRSPSRGSR